MERSSRLADAMGPSESGAWTDLFSPSKVISRSYVLSHQLRQRPVFPYEILGAAREVGELRGRHVDPQPLIQRGEDVPKMHRPALRLVSPARGRTEHLARPHSAARHQRTADTWPMV